MLSELRYRASLRHQFTLNDDDRMESSDGVEDHLADAQWNFLSTTDARSLSSELSSKATPMSDYDYPTFPVAFLLEPSPPYGIVINGYLMPFLAAFTLVTNTLVVTVLLRRHMRTPTNALLVALAASDTLTSVSPVPVWVRFYTISSRPDADWVPYNWCFVYYLSMDYLPSMFHTASVWMTTAIAGQRYLRVCRPPDSFARRLVCSTKGARRIAIGIFVVAIATHLIRLVEMTYSPIDLPSRAALNPVIDAPSANGNGTVMTSSPATAAAVPKSFADTSTEFDLRQRYVTGCRVELSSFVESHEDTYFSVYYWTRVIFVHLVPCALLITFNLCLVRTLLEASRRRRIWRSREPASHIPMTSNPDHSPSMTADPDHSPSMTALNVEKSLIQGKSVAPNPTSLAVPRLTEVVISPNVPSTGSVAPNPTSLAVPQLTEVVISPNVPSTGSAKDSAIGSSNSHRLRVAGHAGHGPSSTRATVMLMIVVGVSLIVEIPLMLIFVMVIVENAIGVDLYEDSTRHTAELIVNLFITISYPVNFFVYCSMSHEFRRTFAAMFARHQ